MTNDEMIQDLKQFIAVTVSQAEQRINDNLGGRLGGVENRLSKVEVRLSGVEGRLSSLETKVDTIQDAIADAISQANESTDAAIQDHKQRLRRLEQKAA